MRPLPLKSIDLAELGQLPEGKSAGFRVPIPTVETRLAIYAGAAAALVLIIVETLIGG